MHAVEVRSSQGVVRVLHGETATIGRRVSSTVRTTHPLVAETHLTLAWDDDTAIVHDQGSLNGTFHGSTPVRDLALTQPVTLCLGDPVHGETVTLSPISVTDDIPGRVLARSSIILGRSAEADIVVDDRMASRRHALLRLRPWPSIEDLGSANGTQVNGRTVSHAALHDDDIVTIGNTDYLFRSGRLMLQRTPATGIYAVSPTTPRECDVPTPSAPTGTPPAPTAGVVPTAGADLVVRGVDYAVDRGTKLLLRGIDFTARAGTVTALIGPSGAGKTTLVRVITGLCAPSAGSVTFAERDIHTNYASMRSRIGFVPQDDIVHTSLTVRVALEYAAELRLPKDTTKAQRGEICRTVLRELDLADRSRLRIDKLSGGERKRVSVAIELITSPALLVLDEPTSGLDPALDRQIMELLDRLAGTGRTIIVVTHSLAQLKLVDQVVFLAPGGLPAYSGPPDGIGEAFHSSDWADIFSRVSHHPKTAWQSYLLRTGTPPGEAETRPDERRAASAPRSTRKGRASSRPLALARGAPGRSTAPPLPVPHLHGQALRQWWALVRRQFRLISADVSYGVFLVALPIVLALLTMMVPGQQGFGPYNPLSKPPTEQGQLLALLVFGGCFMGSSLSIRDIVGERPVYRRERAAGLPPFAYVSSKMFVYAVAASLQALVMTLIVLGAKPRPGSGAVLISGSLELYVDVALVTICSALLGMALSALVTSSDQTMPVLVVVIMAQLVMSGGIIPVTGRAVLEQVSYAFPARWGYAAAAATADLRGNQPLAQPDALWTHGAEHWWLAATLIAAMGLLYTVVTIWRLWVVTRKSGT